MVRALLVFGLVTSLFGCGDDDACPGCLDVGCDGGMCGDVLIGPESCRNGVFDEGEADVDCGGPCGGCGEGAMCSVDDDCAGRCDEGICTSPQCSDEAQNGTETDVDCGGSCPACQPGEGCEVGEDCAFGECGAGHLCVPLECVDGSVNGDETDVDCGGGICSPCGAGRTCSGNTDCSSQVCTGTICAEPTCSDGVANGAEEAVDCGGDCAPCHCVNGAADSGESDVDCGGACSPCAPGLLCVEDGDCDTFACSTFSGRCIPPSCFDGVISGGEPDVDCGAGCDPCFEGGACFESGDCRSRSCVGDACVAPTCDDGEENGDEEGRDCGGSCPRACSCFDDARDGEETDVDCGGPCPACADGLLCEGAGDCASGLCFGETCRPVACGNGMRDAGEVDVDCGGDCPACGAGAMCGMPADCRSRRCESGTCASSSCVDGVRNGDESDVDCGGRCAPCDTSDACETPRDCTSGVCRASVCAGPSCTDGVLGGDEEDIDCGGSCGPCTPASCRNGSRDAGEAGVDCGGPCAGCASGSSCTVGGDCASGRCAGSTCAPSSCSDGFRSDAETDVDCGGPCAPCVSTRGCRRDADCESGVCAMAVCRRGPTASFATSHEGAAPLPVSVTTAARAGDAALLSVTYDFGEGGGFSTDRQHVYRAPGYYTIRQRARDASGGVDEAALAVRVESFDVRLDPGSATARLRLERDELTAIFDETFAEQAVGTTRTIAPGSGIFYLEGEWLTGLRGGNGIAIASASHTGELGSDDQSLSVFSSGSIFHDGIYQGGSVLDPAERHVGIVIDYRGASPTAHVLYSDDAPPVVVPLPAITTPLRAIVGGVRTAVEPQVRLNPGNDRRAHPFHYDPAARTGLPVMLGFGGQESGPVDAPPVVIAADVSTPLGTPVRLTASATDAEDGDITHSLRWTDTAITFADQRETIGPDFLFDPPTLGLHRVRARVYDAAGHAVEAVIRVLVTGTLPRAPTVRMVVEPTTGAGVVISADGLSVHYTVHQKSGVRANQGILEGFHYFEARREGILTSQGAGLVTALGSLDPYRQEEVPWSCSAQVLGGTWRNFVRIGDWDTSERVVGFAVDYRGESPIVYYVVGGIVTEEIRMTEITIPLYPMLYGFPSEAAGEQWSVNFGESPFAQDPRAALTLYGVDATALALSWGR